MEMNGDKDRITVEPTRPMDAEERLVPSIELELPGSPKKIISQAIKDESAALSRRIDPGEITVTMAPNEVGPDSLAVLVSKLPRDPRFEKISLEGLEDPQILFDAAVQGVSGLMVLSETASDHETEEKIKELADLVTAETGSLITKTKKPSEIRKALSGVTKKAVGALSVLSFLITACNADKIPVVTPDATPIEPTATEVTPTATEVASTPTSTPTETPTPTEAPVSPRPDFESMTDDELLQAVDEWGQYFADQIDCSPGIQGLPTPTSSPKLVEVNSYRDVFTWRTEYLGSYKAPLTDKNNLPAGYINCLYFASSEPGGVFTVWGGGTLWGEEMSAFAYNELFGLQNMGEMDDWVSSEELLPLLEPGSEYELSLYTTNDSWSSLDLTMKRLDVRDLSDSAGYTNGGITPRIRYWFSGRLPANYPAVNGQKLINNPAIPVSARLRPAGSE